MNKFWAGMIVMTAIRSLEQDMMGKEHYMKLMDIAWVSPWYTVPIALVYLYVAWKLYNNSTPID